MDLIHLFLLTLLIVFLTAGFASLFLLAGILCLLACLEIRSYWRRRVIKPWRRFRSYLKDIGTSGYLPPPMTRRAFAILRAGSRLLKWFQVGSVRVLGEENLRIETPAIFISNHVYYADAALITSLFPRPARYMAAVEVMRFAGGLLGLLCATFGAFAVDRRKGHGASGRNAAVKVLTSGQQLVMFPEGWCSLDDQIAPFRNGAARIAQEAAKQLGTTVQIVPMHISYGRYPGAFGKKLGSNLAYFWVFFNFWYYRRGGTVVIGKPIGSDALPKDERAATQILYDRVGELAPVR